MDPVAYRREVRIGVVMYGGVSLAIYMNGVAQELFSLARATAEGVEGARSGTVPRRARGSAS